MGVGVAAIVMSMVRKRRLSFLLILVIFIIGALKWKTNLHAVAGDEGGSHLKKLKFAC